MCFNLLSWTLATAMRRVCMAELTGPKEEKRHMEQSYPKEATLPNHSLDESSQLTQGHMSKPR